MPTISSTAGSSRRAASRLVPTLPVAPVMTSFTRSPYPAPRRATPTAPAAPAPRSPRGSRRRRRSARCGRRSRPRRRWRRRARRPRGPPTPRGGRAGWRTSPSSRGTACMPQPSAFGYMTYSASGALGHDRLAPRHVAVQLDDPGIARAADRVAHELLRAGERGGAGDLALEDPRWRARRPPRSARPPRPASSSSSHDRVHRGDDAADRHRADVVDERLRDRLARVVGVDALHEALVDRRRGLGAAGQPPRRARARRARSSRSGCRWAARRRRPAGGGRSRRWRDRSGRRRRRAGRPPPARPRRGCARPRGGRGRGRARRSRRRRRRGSCPGWVATRIALTR